eukprot:207981-Rhodomonas_salina.1
MSTWGTVHPEIKYKKPHSSRRAGTAAARGGPTLGHSEIKDKKTQSEYNSYQECGGVILPHHSDHDVATAACFACAAPSPVQAVHHEINKKPHSWYKVE